jgi:hypothetical protein
MSGASQTVPELVVDLEQRLAAPKLEGPDLHDTHPVVGLHRLTSSREYGKFAARTDEPPMLRSRA